MSAKSTVLRVAASVLLLGAGWLSDGASGVVWCAPAIGALMAAPIMTLCVGYYRAVRRHVYRDLEGRNYAYRGITIRVIEDEQG